MATSTDKCMQLTNEPDASYKPMLVPSPPYVASLSQPAPLCGPVISRQPEPNSGGGVSVVNTQPIQAQQAPMQPKVVYVRQQPFRENDDTLCCAIFATLCCCWICGLCAICNAIRAKTEWDAGNEQKARSLNKDAKDCTKAAIISGIIFISISVVLQILKIAMGSQQKYA